MDGAWLARIRWRRRGAWLWPIFIVATLADAAIGHALPPAGETQTVLAAALSGLVLNLLAVILLSGPAGALIRRARQDLPKIVARDYGGTITVAAVTGAMLIAGVLHDAAIQQHRRAMRDAISRAQAWIGDHAPAAFRRNLAFVSAFAIEPGSVYRICVPSADGRRTYCVIVKSRMPFASSVTFAGYEPNSAISTGTG